MNQPPPAPRSATVDPSAIAERVHDLIGLLPRVAIGPLEQAQILRREQPPVALLRCCGDGRLRRRCDHGHRPPRPRGSSATARPGRVASVAASSLWSLRPRHPRCRAASSPRPTGSRRAVGLVEQAALEHEVANRPAGRDRLLRDLGGRRVADVRAERGGGGRAAIEQLAARARVGRRCRRPPRARSAVIASRRIVDACSAFQAMTGIITFSSSWPASHAAARSSASQPITWKQTWLTISGTDGFTLPGMIDDPGCTAGSAISARPARGPMLSSRRSLAILPSSTARRRIAPGVARARRPCSA